MGDSVLLVKSKAFAVRVVNLHRYLTSIKGEYTLSKQLLRSGTSIGANVHEANYAQSRKDFISKMQIALKETGETEYWLELLYETNYLTESEFLSIFEGCSELKRLLISTLKTAKNQNSEK